MIVPAVRDDLRITVGCDALDSRLHIVWWHVKRAWKMVLPVVWLRKHLEQEELLASRDLLLKLVARDGARFGQRLSRYISAAPIAAPTMIGVIASGSCT